MWYNDGVMELETNEAATAVVWEDAGIRNRLTREPLGGITYSWQFLDQTPEDSWIKQTYIEPWVVYKLREVLE